MKSTRTTQKSRWFQRVVWCGLCAPLAGHAISAAPPAPVQQNMAVTQPALGEVPIQAIQQPLPEGVVVQDIQAFILALGGQYPAQLAAPVPTWIAWSIAAKKPMIKSTASDQLDNLNWLDKASTVTEDRWAEVRGTIAVARHAPFVMVRQEFISRLQNMRALAAWAQREEAGAARFDAVQSLMDLAFSMGGVYRDECGRVIRSMGAVAVPGLVRASRARSTDRAAAILAQAKRNYADVQLGRLGAKTPAAAMNWVNSVTGKVALLKAYGAVQEPQAVTTVVDATASSVDAIRSAARWAAAQYGYEGPNPPRAPRKELKQSRGRKTDKPKFLFLNARALVVVDAADRLQAAGQLTAQQHKTMTAFDPLWDPGEEARILKQRAQKMLTQLFAFQDSQRQAPLEAAFQQGQAAYQRGDFAQAVQLFNGLLLRSADVPPQAKLMAQAYVSWAGTPALSPQKKRRALQKALLLDPERPDASDLRKQIQTLQID